MSIDKTDGCMMYLSETSKNAQIITAKSSEMNILIPDSSGEYVSKEKNSLEAIPFMRLRTITITTEEPLGGTAV